MVDTALGAAGEWFNADPEAIIAQTGAGPNVSDAFTINGLPGPLYNCSSKGKTRPIQSWFLEAQLTAHVLLP